MSIVDDSIVNEFVVDDRIVKEGVVGDDSGEPAPSFENFIFQNGNNFVFQDGNNYIFRS